MHLSVIIPAFNEEINLRRGVLDSVSEYLRSKKFSWEVIVVNDGSIDATTKLMNEFIKSHKNFRMYSENHSGKGGSLLKGFMKSTGDIVLFCDMDQSTPIDQLDKFLVKFEKGFDIVIGSRHGRPGQTAVRKLMAYGFVVLRTFILRLPYIDTQCGFKAYKRDVAKNIFDHLKLFNFKKSGSDSGSVTAGFDLEVLYVARKLGYKVAEVPVEWYEYGDRKEVKPIKDSWEGLRDMLKIRVNAIMGRYQS